MSVLTHGFQFLMLFVQSLQDWGYTFILTIPPIAWVAIHGSIPSGSVKVF